MTVSLTTLLKISLFNILFLTSCAHNTKYKDELACIELGDINRHTNYNIEYKQKIPPIKYFFHTEISDMLERLKSHVHLVTCPSKLSLEIKYQFIFSNNVSAANTPRRDVMFGKIYYTLGEHKGIITTFDSFYKPSHMYSHYITLKDCHKSVISDLVKKLEIDILKLFIDT